METNGELDQAEKECENNEDTEPDCTAPLRQSSNTVMGTSIPWPQSFRYIYVCMYILLKSLLHGGLQILIHLSYLFIRCNH